MEIEIPFGAFDSKLMHQEISIQEGFEATIEGNKIIPKKIEPEDEKFERTLHSISSKMSLHLCDIFTEEEFQCFDTWSNAWIEKQGTKESNKMPIWKHWKDGIAGKGDGEGKPIYLIKDGNTYNLSSCIGFECDYIELSELDNLMLEKQGDIDFFEVKEVNNVWNNASDFPKAEAGRSILLIENDGRTELLKSPSAERLFYFRPTSLKMWAYVDELISITTHFNVKEAVDLEKEYDNEFFKDPVFGKLVNRNAGISIAKHFFQLGKKAQSKDMTEALRTEYEKGMADVIAKTLEWINVFNDNNYIMQYSDSCEHPINEIIEWYKNYINRE